MKRSGSADLPLHGGRVPSWLAERMTQLGTAITEQIVACYGTSEFLSRLSDPFWFQAFGAVMGMDWHSSGITTSVMGALKRGLNTRFSDFSLFVCGGRGRHSRRTPDELRSFASDTGLDGKRSPVPEQYVVATRRHPPPKKKKKKKKPLPRRIVSLEAVCQWQRQLGGLPGVRLSVSSSLRSRSSRLAS